MQLLSLKNEGKLYYEGVEETFSEELALELDEDPDNVKMTISFLQNCGLLEITDVDEYILTEVPASIGSESVSAERMRKCRANKNKKLLGEQESQCDNAVTASDSTVTAGDTEKEIEKEIEKRENINILARSSGKQTSEPEADVAAIILNDGSEWRPTEALFAEYVRLYPNVDVKQQFNEMRGWCIANPQKRKTRRGVVRFINTWLSKEQNKGGARGSAGYKQNSGDYGNIAERLLQENRGDLF